MAETIPATALLLIDESRQEEINVTHTPFTIGRLQDRDLVLAHAFISAITPPLFTRRASST